MMISSKTTVAHIQDVKIELNIDLRRAYRTKDQHEIGRCRLALRAADQIIKQKRKEEKRKASNVSNQRHIVAMKMQGEMVNA